MAQWQKGESGNPNGRPAGSKNKSKEMIARQLVYDNAPELTQKMIDMALEGDQKILLYLADKFMIKRTATPISLADPTDKEEIWTKITRKVGDGTISPEEGEQLFRRYTSFADLVKQEKYVFESDRNAMQRYRDDLYDDEEDEDNASYRSLESKLS